jgi:hypothetical protein
MYSSAKSSGVGWKSASRKRTEALAPTSATRTSGAESAIPRVRVAARRRAVTAAASTRSLSAATSGRLKNGEGAVSRALSAKRWIRAYGPVQAVLVMSPPGPCLYQDLVPTVLLMQYEVAVEEPRMTTFLTPWSYACICVRVRPT